METVAYMSKGKTIPQTHKVNYACISDFTYVYEHTLINVYGQSVLIVYRLVLKCYFNVKLLLEIANTKLFLKLKLS